MIDDQMEQQVEQYRHECEIRAIMAMKSREQRAAYLKQVEGHRGKRIAKILRDDVIKLWDQRQ